MNRNEKSKTKNQKQKIKKLKNKNISQKGKKGISCPKSTKGP
jgi:hypothetical protein